MQRRTVITGLAAVALFLGACGGGDDDAASGEGGGDSTLTIALSSDVQSFDPNMLGDITSLNVMRNVAETLVAAGEGGELEPLLAESWENVDPTTWEFKLREGITFHNGEPFNSDAVKYTLDRLINPDLENARPSRWEVVERIDVVDEYTVRVVTKEPKGLVPALLTYIPIVAPEHAEEIGAEGLAAEPVGTGPYVFDSWTRDDRLTLTANPDYWQDPADVDTVVFRPIPEDSTRVAELTTGAVDYAVNIPPALLPQLETTDGIETGAVPSLRFVYIGLNIEKNPALADPLVRQALNFAVDKQGIIDSLFDGEGRIMSHPVHDQHFGFNPDVEPYPYDPDMARDLLAQAGAEDLTVSFDSPEGRYLLDSEVAQAVAGQLEEVGVTVDLQLREWGNFTELNQARELGDLYLLGWGNVPGADADQMYGNLLTSDSSSSYYSNPELDALVAQGSASTDPAEREAIYADAAQLTHEDAPWIYLYAQTDLYAASDRVDGLVPGADESLDIYSASITE